MIATPTLLEIAARHLAALLDRIVGRATNLITAAATLTPGHVRATNHIARVIELCALLIVRLATNPGYQEPLPPEDDEENDEEDDGEDDGEDDEDQPSPDSADHPDAPEAPERPEKPERPDRQDTPPPGAKLSTLALVAEIQRQLQLAAIAIGQPLPAELETLCREAIAAAMKLENANLMNLVAEFRSTTHPNDQTRPEPPAPGPTKTLEL